VALVAALVLLVLLGWLVYSGAVSYFVAEREYQKLLSTSRLSQRELEEALWFSSDRSIDCSGSSWIRSYSDEPDRRCHRYLIPDLLTHPS
jgi:hypothetical protein